MTARGSGAYTVARTVSVMAWVLAAVCMVIVVTFLIGRHETLKRHGGIEVIEAMLRIDALTDGIPTPEKMRALADAARLGAWAFRAAIATAACVVVALLAMIAAGVNAPRRGAPLP